MKALLVPVSELCRLLGVKRTTAFALIKEHRVDSVKINAKRLVTVSSIERLVEQSLSAAPSPSDKPNISEGRR